MLFVRLAVLILSCIAVSASVVAYRDYFGAQPVTGWRDLSGWVLIWSAISFYRYAVDAWRKQFHE
jgi:hypothetical protein